MINTHDIRNAKILVVDDCADNVDLLVEILHMEGYSCVSSSLESSQVCNLHARNDYDLILLDMHIPGWNGHEVIEGLKKIEKDAYLPVLAITGDCNYKISALAAGPGDFIGKP